MKRWWPLVLGIALIAIVIAIILWGIGSFKSQRDNGLYSNAQSPSNTTNKNITKACSIFTLPDAKVLLGDTAKGGELSPVTISKDVNISTCSYKQDNGNNVPVTSNKLASLKVNFPNSDKGRISNQNQFSALKPANVQDMAGYGASAYWDSDHGQLNILKNNTWYILSYGPVTPDKRSLDETKKMADLLIEKL
jgi:hypothetical protein